MSPLRAVLRILAWCAVLWPALCLPTLWLWPLEPADRPLRLSKPEYLEPVRYSLFASQIEEAAYELARRCPLPDRRRIVLFGSSGSRGFDPGPVGADLGAEEVLNVSVILSNFTQLRQIYADLRTCLGADGLRHSTFVVLPTLGNFTSNAMRRSGPYTEYEQAKLSTRLFNGRPGELQPVLSRNCMPMAIEAMRPLLLARRLLFDARARATRWWHRSDKADEDAGASATREQSLAMIAKLQPEAETGGPYAPEQTAELERLLRDMRTDGAGLVIAEQPIQRWLRDSGASFSRAHETIQGMAVRMNIPYIDLSTSGADEEFHDAAHANLLGEARWSARLHDALAAQFGSPGSAASTKP